MAEAHRLLSVKSRGISIGPFDRCLLYAQAESSPCSLEMCPYHPPAEKVQIPAAIFQVRGSERVLSFSRPQFCHGENEGNDHTPVATMCGARG